MLRWTRAIRSAPPVDIVPLGGLGEFGLNMMAISCGETTIVIDAGSMFPEPDLLGVDLIVPDLAYLEARAAGRRRWSSPTATRTTSAPCRTCCRWSTGRSTARR